MIEIRITVEAQLELQKAVEYYAAIHTDIAYSFLQNFRHIESLLSRFPMSGRVIRKNVRRFVMKDFPFGVLYVVKQNHIKIIAVPDFRRKPET